MSGGDLLIPVENLVGHTGRDRAFQGVRQVNLRLGESGIDGPMSVTGRVVGTIDGARATFSARATAELACNRCLTEWSEEIAVEGSQHYRIEPDEDGYAIVDGMVDVAGPAQDELALALPATPLCREDCRGLCPTCGSDLNRDPCDGHGDDSDSPFAALRDLFDS